MKKVLIISQHGWPPKINAQILRLANLARHLPKYGWEPIIVARETKKYEFEDKKYAKELKGIKVYRYNGFLPWKHRLNRFLQCFFIPDVFLIDLMWNFRKIKKIIEKENPDVIFASTPPSGLIVGYLLSKKTNKKLVVDYADPWLVSGCDLRFQNKLYKKIEKSILLSSSKLFVASNAHMKDINSIHRVENRMIWLPNGFNDDDFFIKKQTNKKIKIFLYGGSVYSDFDISFLEAFSEVFKHHKGFEVEFAGDISDKKKDYIEKTGKSFVKIVGRLPKKKFLEEMMGADVLIFSRSDKYDDFLSSTMVEYLGSKKAIMAFVRKGSLLYEIFTKSGTSFVFEHGEKEMAKEFIIKAIDGKIEVKPNMEYIMQFEWGNIAKKLAYALEEISNE
jgi:UDP-N-acetylglucosamine:LPS N-acetylglucosamine transferase